MLKTGIQTYMNTAQFAEFTWELLGFLIESLLITGEE